MSLLNVIKISDGLDKQGFYKESDAIFNSRLAQTKNKSVVPANAERMLKTFASQGIRTIEQLKEWYVIANNVPRTVIERYPGLPTPVREKLLIAGDYADRGLDFASLVKNDFAPLKSTAQFIGKTTGLAEKAAEIASKNPKLANAAAKLIAPLGRFFPALQRVISGGFMGPWAGIIITLAFSYPKIMEYLKAADDGTFKAKYIDDVNERAQLFELLSSLVGQRLLLIPGMQVIGGALMGASMISASGRELAEKMYGDKTREKISTSNFIVNTKADFVNLFKTSDLEVRKVAQPLFKLIVQNPYIKNIEILNLPEISNISWIKNKSSSENQLKNAQFMGLIISLKKILSTQKI